MDESKNRPWLKTKDPKFDLRSLRFCPVLSIETHGAPDDVQTVLEKLPKSEPLLRALTRNFTIACRLKASYRMDRRDGVIEVAGDQRKILREFFEKEGIAFIG